MQFNLMTVVLALATMAAAEKTVTVYACGPSPTPTALPGTVTSGIAAPTGVASTGVVTPPQPSTSPIVPVTGAASHMGASAGAMVVAGAVALFL